MEAEIHGLTSLWEKRMEKQRFVLWMEHTQKRRWDLGWTIISLALCQGREEGVLVTGREGFGSTARNLNDVVRKRMLCFKTLLSWKSLKNGIQLPSEGGNAAYRMSERMVLLSVKKRHQNIRYECLGDQTFDLELTARYSWNETETSWIMAFLSEGVRKRPTKCEYLVEQVRGNAVRGWVPQSSVLILHTWHFLLYWWMTPLPLSLKYPDNR